MDIQAIFDILNTPIDADQMHLFSSLLLGIGISASCGFRVFIPPLILSAAALYFGIDLPKSMHWLATYPTFFTLLTASMVEVGAFYIPWVDHFLDALTGPASMIAGTLITGTLLNGQVDSAVQWSLALIAGGGAAATMQSLGNLGRTASLFTTGGLANPIVATIENLLAVLMPILVIALPFVSLFIALLVIGIIVMLIIRFKKRTEASPDVPVA